MTKEGNKLGVHFNCPSIDIEGYATDRIQKGLILSLGDRHLDDEGIGFGVPLFKFGMETVFPGGASFTTTRDNDKITIRVSYTMNLVARIWLGNSLIKGRAFYQFHELFSRLHREFPRCRKMIAETSRIWRRLSPLTNRFKEIDRMGLAEACYQMDADVGKICVSLNFHHLTGTRCTEIIVANEQGASHFDTYQDSDGNLLGGQAIGTWDEVLAEKASFVNSHDAVAFTLSRVPGAQMFRGRELVADRLAWSGLDYVLPGQTTSFEYKLELRVG